MRALLLLVELLPISNSVKTGKGKGKGKRKGRGMKRKNEDDNIDEEQDEEPENETLKIEFPNKFLVKLLPVRIPIFFF